MATTEIQLEVTRRHVLGKQVKALRRQGVIPANIYGRSIPSTPVQLTAISLQGLLRSIESTSVIALRVSGEEDQRPVMVRRIQRHPTSESLLHVDFFQVSLTETIRLEVPIMITGEAPAVDVYHGVLLPAIDSLLVEGLPGKIPAHIAVDVSNLQELNDAIYIRDLQLPSDLTIFADADGLIVKIAAPAVATVAGEEPAAPELIQKEPAEKEG